MLKEILKKKLMNMQKKKNNYTEEDKAIYSEELM